MALPPEAGALPAAATSTDHGLVLFDGVCNLCHGSVRFIVDRDPRGVFRFASLQSQVGAEAARALGADASQLDSILLIEGGRLYRESTAALRIARRLSGLWPLLALFLVLPALLRDPVYRLIARYRYRWFGKTDVCRLPAPGEAERFLQDP